jgi:anti-sigma regulatory factor (Ser/Thr protein kinase)
VETLLELSEPAVLANVRPIRHRVMRAAEDAGAAGSVVDEVGLCVGEAAANAARHAYAGVPGTIGALVQADELSLTVTVRDRGSGLGPQGEGHTAAGAGRPPEEHGGFGLRIIESLARELSIWSAPGRGTVLRMRFSLEPSRTMPPARRSSGGFGPGG